jgi:threonine/homoserine/homoserine lactone efflux protein
MLKIFASGLLISFLGTLPLGTLNITAFQIAASQNVNEAIVFAIAVIIVELIVVLITLYGAKKINFSSKLFFYMLPLGVFLLTHLAILSFTSAYTTESLESSLNLFPMIKSSFTLGLLLSVINPMHFPFWMSWNSFLITRKTLSNKPGIYPSYVTGIGLGSIAGLMIFILAGKIIFQNYQQYSFIISFAIGCLYTFFALFLLYSFYKKHLKKLTQ